jgi:uncharacterized protein
LNVGLFVNALAGLLFGLGLLLSGMADPAKVQNFLDLFGTWDPSLAFVMAGAVATTFVGYRVAFRGPTPLLSPQFVLPSREPIDGRSARSGSVRHRLGYHRVLSRPGPRLRPIACNWDDGLRSRHARRDCARSRPAHAAVRTGVRPRADAYNHRQNAGRGGKHRLSMRDAFSRKSNIDIAFSSLLNLPHPA